MIKDAQGNEYRIERISDYDLHLVHEEIAYENMQKFYDSHRCGVCDNYTSDECFLQEGCGICLAYSDLNKGHVEYVDENLHRANCWCD